MGVNGLISQAKGWLQSPRRVVTDILTIVIFITAVYSIIAPSHIGIVPFAFGAMIVCSLIISPEFKEGKLNIGGNFVNAEPENRAPIVNADDLNNIDMSKFDRMEQDIEGNIIFSKQRNE